MTKKPISYEALSCKGCEHSQLCLDTYGVFFRVMKGSPNCKKSYEGFGNGRKLSKRETGRARG